MTITAYLRDESGSQMLSPCWRKGYFSGIVESTTLLEGKYAVGDTVSLSKGFDLFDDFTVAAIDERSAILVLKGSRMASSFL